MSLTFIITFYVIIWCNEISYFNAITYIKYCDVYLRQTTLKTHFHIFIFCLANKIIWSKKLDEWRRSFIYCEVRNGPKVESCWILQLVVWDSFSTLWSGIYIAFCYATLHKKSENRVAATLWKVAVFVVILDRIFPHSDWTRRDILYLSIFSPNMGKCRPE